MNPYEFIKASKNLNVEFQEWTFTFIKIINKKNKVHLRLIGNYSPFICLEIIAMKDCDSVELYNLKFCKDCFDPPYTKEKGGGSILLALAIYVAFDILHASAITLFDTSSIKCHGKTISLLKLGLLTMGDSWYARYGFLPENPNMRDLYLKHKQILTNSSILNLSKALQEKIRKYVTTTENEQVMCIVKRLFTVSCKIYMKLHEDILLDLNVNIPRNYGQWIKER